MKVLSDTQIRSHLFNTINKKLLQDEYVPMIQQALADYGANPNIVPERTVKTSSHKDCDTTHLFMPCVAPDNVGFKVISGGSYNSKQGLGFQGFTSVLDWQTGQLLGVVNGKTLTAFRTALTSFSVVLQELEAEKSLKPLNVTVFGTGPQAYWHVFLVARAYEISKVTVISRSLESAERLRNSLREDLKIEVSALSLADESVGETVTHSDVIFGCIPSTEPTIKKEYLDKKPLHRQIIVLIGSYKPHMVELDPEFVKENFKSQYKILVDSKEHTLAEAGELIQSNLGESDLISLHEYFGKEGDKGHILENQITVAKIVGLLIMDIYAAKHMLEHVDAPKIEFD